MSFKWPFKKKPKAGIVGMNPEDLWEFLRRKKCGEDFSGLDFRGVLFHDIDFSTDDFPAVGFRGCDLSKTIFCECVIDGDKFYDADFLGAVFVNCDFRDMFLMNGAIAKYGHMMPYVFDSHKDFEYNIYATIIQPIQMDGEFVGYKILATGILKPQFKGSTDGIYALEGLALAELVIPADAGRIIFANGKCRASKARVVEIKHWETGEKFDVGWSAFFGNTQYDVGEVVEADGFNSCCGRVCSNGIHFFLSRDEAIAFAKENTAPPDGT